MTMLDAYDIGLDLLVIGLVCIGLTALVFLFVEWEEDE